MFAFENFNIDSNANMKTNLSQSEAIIIQVIERCQKDDIFLICFKNTIIIIEQFLLKTLQEQIFNFKKLSIFFLTKDSQNHFRQIVQILDDQIKPYDDFKNEIDSLQNQIKNIILNPALSEIPGIEKYIKSSISVYLIGESYVKINSDQKNIYKQMIKNGLNIKSTTKKDIKIIEFEENDFIELILISSGNSSEVFLSYHIKKRELFAIKRFKEIDRECFKLINREIENYRKIDFPLLPKFYGIIKGTNSIVIQYINGQAFDIEEIKLKDEDKVLIILEMILIIEYFHKNHFVYRDLKLNNVIIDENKSIHVIDFDRMISIDNIQNNEEDHTVDFATKYMAPEVNYGKIAYKNDIYSLGKMIENITKDTVEFNNFSRK